VHIRSNVILPGLTKTPSVVEPLAPLQAAIDVWQSEEEGFYDVQTPSEHEHRARGRLRSEKDRAVMHPRGPGR
jgi:hypothetical protein